MKKKRIFVALFLLAGLTMGAAAQTGNPPAAGGGQGSQGSGSAQGMGQEGEHEHRRPPPQALAACEGKSSGAACSFTGRDNDTVNGTCFAPPEGGNGQSSAPLACRPAHHGHGRHGGQGNGA